MYQFMVRGLFIFPYAQCPSHGIAADYLFPIAWEVVKDLECADFKVISLTGDKASPNRKSIRMHRLGTVQKFGTTYKLETLTVLKSDTYTSYLMYHTQHFTQPVQCVLLFSVLAENSALFQFLRIACMLHSG